MCYYEVYKNNILSIRKNKRVGYCSKYDTYITVKQGLNHCFKFDINKFFIERMELCDYFCLLTKHPYWQNQCLVKKYYPVSLDDDIEIYTDASYKKNNSRYAFIALYKNNIINVQNGKIKKSIKNSNDAEIYAIVKALKYVNIMKFKNKIKLYSDNKKAIKTQYYYYNLGLLDNISIELYWIPRKQNKLADKACHQVI